MNNQILDPTNGTHPLGTEKFQSAHPNTLTHRLVYHSPIGKIFSLSQRSGISLKFVAIAIFLIFSATYGFIAIDRRFPRSPKISSAPENSLYLYETGSQSFTAKIGTKTSTAPFVSFTPTAGQTATIAMVGAESVKSEREGNSVVYKNILPGTDVTYTPIPQGIKEEIIIGQRVAKAEYIFNFNTTAHPRSITADYYSPFFFDNQNNYQFHLEKPFAVDAVGKRTEDVSMSIRKSKDNPNSYQVMISVSPEWLTSKDRVYPVTVDPTIVYDTSAEFAAGVFNRVKDTGSGSFPSLETWYQELPSDWSTVGLWHFNETADNSCSGGQDACDFSGNLNHGTATGTTIVTTTQRLGAAARSFNGTTDYLNVTVGAGTSLDIDYVPVTMEAWIKTNSVVTAQEIVSRGTAGANGYGIRVNSTGKINLGAHGGGNFDGLTSLNTGEWYHVAGVINGAESAIYINGVLDQVGTVNMITSTLDFKIGADFDGANPTLFFNGLIDEVRVSNTARSAHEIKMSAQRRPYSVFTSDVVDFGTLVYIWNPLTWTELGVATGDGETLKDTTSLVAQWHFNETSGTTASNNAGTCGASCNGTLTGFDSTASQDADPDSSWTANNRRWGAGALTYDETDTVVTITDNNFVSFGSAGTDSPFSISTWVYPKTIAGTADGNWLVSKRDAAANEEYQLAIYQGVISFAIFTNNSNYLALLTLNTLSPGRWYHIVGTYDASETLAGMKVYVNGVLQQFINSSAGTYTGMLNGTANLLLGKPFWTTTLNFNGVMDTTSIFSRALSHSEILSNYNVGNIELQTRVGADTTPDNGDWEEWRPVTGETSIENFDSPLSKDLISYWPMDETSGSRFDRWGTNTVAAFGTGGVSSAVGIINNAADFESGETDYLEIADNSSISTGDIDYTLSGWVKLESTGVQSSIMSKSGATFGTREYILQYTGTNLGFIIYDSSGNTGCLVTATNLGTLSSGVWYYFVAWHDATANTCNIQGNNGTANSSSETAIPFDNTGQLRIGNWGPTALPFDGLIDEVSFWKRTLTTSEKTYLYNSGSPKNTPFETYPDDLSQFGGLRPSLETIIAKENSASTKYTTGQISPDSSTVGLWHFEETGGTGAYLKDSTAGVASNATPNNITSIKGISGRGLSFNGTTSYATVTDVSELNPSQLTASAWIRTTTATNSFLIHKYNTIAPFQGYAMVVNSIVVSKTSCWVGGTAWVTSMTSVNDGKWHHIVCTYDGTNSKIYVDGALEGTQANTSTLTYAINLTIGAFNGGASAFFNGYIDELAIYNLAKSTDEIAEIYRQGRDHYFSRVFTSTDLSSYSTLPFYIAADRPGNYLEARVGESSHANYLADVGAAAFFHLDEEDREVTELFPGAVLNTYQWIETDPNANKIAVNEGLVLTAGTVAAWDSAIVSSQSFYTRENGLSLYGKFTTSAGVATPNHMMVGFALNSTSIPSYTNITHALYWNAGAFYVYQDGVLFGGPYGSGYAAGTTYEFLITLYSGGTLARYSVKGGVYTDWTLLLNADGAKSNTPLRVQVSQWQHTGTMKELIVLPQLTLRDQTGNSNNAFTIGSKSIEGIMGRARLFNGTQEFAFTSDSNTLDLTTSGTVQAWFYRTKTQNYQMIVTKGDASNPGGYQLMDSGLTNKIVCRWGQDADTVTSVTAVPNYTWAQVTCVYNGSTLKIYINGVLDNQVNWTTNATANTTNLRIGQRSDSFFYAGAIDEVLVTPTALSADQIRQSYEYATRSHPITIDFAAGLSAGNLIADVNDTSFTIDGLTYGMPSMGANLYAGDTIIVKQNHNGTEYIAQGTVTSVSSSTGAVTVGSWNGGSTFPAAGFTATATVFKWQREYFPLNGVFSGQLNSAQNLTLRYLDGAEGRTIWLDDLKGNTNYLTNPLGSTITSSTGNRYAQFRIINTSSNIAVSATASAVSIDYTPNSAPNIPTLDSPANGAISQPLSPTLQTTATDTNSDYLRYKIQLCTNLAMTTNCQTFDQTLSQTGWSGQNTQTSTAYTSGTQGTYTIQTPLTHSTTYYWRSYAIDPAGTNTFGSTQATPFSFTTNAVPTIPTLDFPADTAVSVPLLAVLKTTSSDVDSDYLRYKIDLCTNLAMTTGCQTFNQTVSQTGWSGQDVQTGTAYASGTQATFTLQSALTPSTTYYWRSYAIDPGGANSFGSTQVTPFSFTINALPNAPSLIAPSNGATGISVTPVFQTTATDVDSDYLRYKIRLCHNQLMTLNCLTYDQTISQTGWSGQNTQTSTAYTSGTQANYTVQSALLTNTQYFWKSYAIDPGGTNTFGTTQSNPFSFTTLSNPNQASTCLVEKAIDNSQITVRWTDNSTVEDGYQIWRIVSGVGPTHLTPDLAANTISYVDTDVVSGSSYGYMIRSYQYDGANTLYSSWCPTTTSTLSTGGFTIF